MSIAAHSTVVPDVSTIGASDGTSVVQVTVTVLDGNDDPVTGAVVTLGVSGTGNTVTDPPAPTGSSGRATGSFSSTVAEEKIVTATVDGTIAVTQTASVTVTPGPPESLEQEQGPDPIARVFAPVSVPPEVRVVDAFGNGVPGIDVVFSQTAGDGMPDPAVVTTDAQGRASTEWRMGLERIQELAAVESTSGGEVAFAVEAFFTGTGSAGIDGVVDGVEWDGAACVPFVADLPGAGTAPAELCGMTDAENVYVLVRVERDPDPRTITAFFFDADGDGLIGRPDDYIQMVQPPSTFQDWHFFDSSDDPDCPGLCSNGDAARGGTTDGAGTYAHDGTAGVFEMSHPLSSGDPLDIDFSPGSRARVTLTLRLCGDPTCSTISDSFVGVGTPLMLLVQ